MPKLAVIGHPVAHSRSPAMQTAALEALGLAGLWSYGAIDLAPEELADRVRALPGAGYVGVNVTVPHKEAALALADSATDAAIKIGAANTLSFQAERIHADNTDAPGLLAAIGQDVQGARALILGAGGSARACAWALTGAGARVSVHNRTPQRAMRLASDLDVEVLDPSATERLPIGCFEVLVNATSVGLGTANAPTHDPRSDAGDLKALRIDADDLSVGTTVIDLVYGRRPTGLIAAASEGGARTIDGIEVLVAQGAASLRAWTGADPPLAAMSAAARSA